MHHNLTDTTHNRPAVKTCSFSQILLEVLSTLSEILKISLTELKQIFYVETSSYRCLHQSQSCYLSILFLQRGIWSTYAGSSLDWMCSFCWKTLLAQTLCNWSNLWLSGTSPSLLQSVPVRADILKICIVNLNGNLKILLCRRMVLDSILQLSTNTLAPPAWNRRTSLLPDKQYMYRYFKELVWLTIYHLQVSFSPRFRYFERDWKIFCLVGLSEDILKDIILAPQLSLRSGIT